MKKFKITALILAGLAIVVVGSFRYLFYLGYREPPNSPDHFLETHDPDTPRGKIVVCVGDSLTHGTVSCNYVDLLSKRLGPKGYTFINAGINGELSFNVLQRLDRVIQCNPDYVTILIGTNDSNWSATETNRREAVKEWNLRNQPSPEDYRRNLLEIISRLKSRTHAKIALLSLPPITEDMNHYRFKHSLKFNEIIREVARKEHVAYLPLHETMRPIIENHKSHPRFKFKDKEYIGYLAFVQHNLLGMSWDEISKWNGFLLLTDYLHLNCRSAGMICDLIEGFIIGG